MCNLLIHIDISAQRKGQVSHLLCRNTWINYHTFDEERSGRLQLVVRLPTIIARNIAEPFGILRLNFKVGFIAYWNVGGLYCCSIRYAWTISTAFLTSELNFSELKLVPISSRTRKHFSRIRTARFPTVSHCIPGPKSGGQYPPPGLPTPRRNLVPEIPTSGVDMRPDIPTPKTEWLTDTCENTTFLQLHWQDVIKCCCNWLFTCYGYLRWRFLKSGRDLQ